MGGTADHVWPRSVRQAIVLQCDAVTGRAELAQHQRIVTELLRLKGACSSVSLRSSILPLEDIVDQREQVIGGNTRLGAAFAGDLHIAVFQFLNFDKTQDAVERRADVVTHAP